MTLGTYPATLPKPQAAQLRPQERRHLSPAGPGPLDVRGVQRARGIAMDLTFALTAAQWAAWYTWWRDTLVWGGAWFQAPYWPMPWGIGAELAFDTQPRVENLGGGVRLVSIGAYVRAAVPLVVDPYDCYIEDFDLGSYTSFGGPGGPAPGGFTTSAGPYGTQINCPSVTNLTYLSIQRAFPARTPFVRLRCKVKVTSTDPEDTCTLVLHDGGGYPVGTTLYVNPRRENTSDPTRRCTIGYRLAGSGTAVEYFTEVLAINTWYQIEVYIEGADLKASVQNLTAGAPTVYTVATLPPFIQYSTYDVLIFAQDGPAPAAPSPTVVYADVQICEPA